MLTDIEIAPKRLPSAITQVAQRLGSQRGGARAYGRFKAKAFPCDHETPRRQGGRQADPCHRHQPYTRRRRQNDNDSWLRGSDGKASQKTRLSLCASLLSAPFSALRAERPAADTRRPCPWRTSTFISPATCMPSPLRTTCYAHASIIIFSRAIHSASTRAASFLSAAWI